MVQGIFKSILKSLCLILLEILRYEYEIIVKIDNFQLIKKNTYIHLSPRTFSEMLFTRI